MEDMDLEFDEKEVAKEEKEIFVTFSRREAKEYISKHLKGIKIKKSFHISPNKRLAFFRKFNCFDNIKLISVIDEHKIAFELICDGEVLSSEGAPALIVKNMDDRTFKKFNSSLMGRALKNYGILAKEETEGLAEDDTTADEGDWVSDPGKGKDDEDDGWG